MKKKILIFGIAAAALAVSCNKEDMLKVDQDKTFTGDKAYFVVNINDVGTSSTKATSNGFQYGSSAEYAIFDANFYFYASDGSFVAEAVAGNPGGTPNTNEPVENIEFDATTVITLQGLTNKVYPRWVVTILNGPEGFTAPNTLEEFEGLLANAGAEGITVSHNGTTYYTMSTASYVGDSENNNVNVYTAGGKNFYFATPVSEDNFSLESLSGDSTSGYKDAAGDPVDPIDIHVERLAAKVYLTVGMSGGTTVGNYNLYPVSNEVSNGGGVADETTLYVRFEGWLLNATAKKSNLMKTIENTTTWSNGYFYPTGAKRGSYLTWGDDWNDAKNFRSYWGKSFNYGIGFAGSYPGSSWGNYDDDEAGTSTDGGTPLNDYLLYTSLNGELNTIGTSTVIGTYQYCAENTNTAGRATDNVIITNKMSSAITSILVKAAIVNSDGSEVEDMVRCDGVLYTVDNYLKYALSHTAFYIAAETEETDNPDYDQENLDSEEKITVITKYARITAADVELVNDYDGKVHVALVSKYTDPNSKDSDGKSNYVGDEFRFYTIDSYDADGNIDRTTAYTAAEVNTYIQEHFNTPFGSDANYFKGGRMYYSIPIEHLNYDYDETYEGDEGETYDWVLEGNYGIVRNHIYYVTIDDIENLGRGIYDPEEVIVPQPEIPTYSLAATIHILSWKIVSQHVSL